MHWMSYKNGFRLRFEGLKIYKNPKTDVIFVNENLFIPTPLKQLQTSLGGATSGIKI